MNRSPLDFKYLFCRLVQRPSGAVFLYEIVLAGSREGRGCHYAGMNGKAHAGLDRHGFVVAYQGAFHQVITMTVGEKAALRRQSFFHHVPVVGVEYVTTERARLTQRKG